MKVPKKTTPTTKKMAVGGKTGGTSQAKTGGSAAGKTLNKAPSSSGGGGGGGGGGFFGGVSNAVRSLTSTDPANVARNREAAARYAAQSALRGGGDGNAGSFGGAFSKLLLGRVRRGSKAPVADSAGYAAPTRPTYVAPPAGYRPGIDPEWNYYQPKPTVAMKNGGKATTKPKGKK